MQVDMKRFSQILETVSYELNGFAILKPGFLDKEQQFVDMLKNARWQLIQTKELKLTPQQAEELYSVHANEPFYKDLCKYMCSDYCYCVKCHKQTSTPIEDMKKLKDKIRDAWSKDEMRNAMHSSDSLANVKRESDIVFN